MPDCRIHSVWGGSCLVVGMFRHDSVQLCSWLHGHDGEISRSSLPRGGELLLLSRRHCWGSCLPRRPGRWLARQPPVGRWAMREAEGLASRLPLVPPLALSPWVSPAFLLFLLFLGEEGGDYLSFEMYASMTAMATMFTMSLTLESKSVKWIGLFSPICIGPMTSVSGEKALMSL